MHLYWERQRAPSRAPVAKPPVPSALATFPKEISTPPRRLIDRVFRIERDTAMPRGGHLAALEQPALLADDIATFSDRCVETCSSLTARSRHGRDRR